MSLTVRKLSYALGAEIGGVDFGKPLPSETFREVHRAFLQHSVLLIRGQSLDRQQFVAFSRRFGKLKADNSRAAEGFAEIQTLINEPRLDSAPDPDYNGSDWHSDVTYRIDPTIISILKAIEIPEVGGDTQFANMYLAYETLSDGMKKLIDGLEGVHMQQEKDLDHSSPERLEASRREQCAAHPVVRAHPETGRKSLFIGDKVMMFAGMTPEESRPLIDFLRSHARRPQFIYRHRWQKDDLLIWDQRCTNHNAIGDFDRRREFRIMDKTTVPGPVVGRRYSEIGDVRNLTHGFTYY